MQPTARIGFVSSRFAGTDGVSLEAQKLASILEQVGHECFYFAGECDCSRERSLIVPEAHFLHPQILARQPSFFSSTARTDSDTRWIEQQRRFLKKALKKFVQQFRIDVLFVQNALSIPLNLPLGLAIADYIFESKIPTLAHHHDFRWERKRFEVSCVEEYLEYAFPPVGKSISHLVINSLAEKELLRTKGVQSTLLPNIMCFEESPPSGGGYEADFREELGVHGDQRVILQPTRVIARKGIELSIDLVAALSDPATLVVTHSANDEGQGYQRQLERYSLEKGVPLIFCGDRVSEKRGRTPDGEKVYILADVYRVADLVTYPSVIEGFGNALLEAVYYRKPLLVNRYPVYMADISERGFDFIEVSGEITAEVVAEVNALLGDGERQKRMVERNYKIGLKYYSFEVAREILLPLLMKPCLLS